jgi:hypothetical protein
MVPSGIAWPPHRLKRKERLRELPPQPSFVPPEAYESLIVKLGELEE